MSSKFIECESGATLVEYGVVLILAISVGGTALVALGNQSGTTMQKACDTLQGFGRVENTCFQDGSGDDG